MLRKYFIDSLVDPDDQSENPVLRWIGVGRIDRLDDPAYFHGFRLRPLTMGMNLKQARGLRPVAPSFTPSLVETLMGASEYIQQLAPDDSGMCIHYFEPSEEVSNITREWLVANSIPHSVMSGTKLTLNYQTRNNVRGVTISREDIYK